MQVSGESIGRFLRRLEHQETEKKKQTAQCEPQVQLKNVQLEVIKVFPTTYIDENGIDRSKEFDATFFQQAKANLR